MCQPLFLKYGLTINLVAQQIEANFSHAFLAEQAGVLVEAPLAGTPGVLAPGAEAFTVFTSGGYTGSMNFNLQLTNPQNIAAVLKLVNP
jgi:hypothetical protein